jgi:hypothetical protein
VIRIKKTGARGRFAYAAIATALICVWGLVTPTGPANAATHYGTVKAITQRMSGPYLPPNFTQNGTYALGKKLTLVCYLWGQQVSGWGGTSNLWYKISDGYYAADVDLSTGSNNPITPACPTISLSAFVAQTKGKSWANASGTLSGECVSLVSQYLLRVKGIKSGARGDAVEYRSGGTGGNKLKSLGFKWSTSQTFKDGDILIWGEAGALSSAGHIGIWYDKKVYDQNDARHSPSRTANYSKFWETGYLGHWSK